LNEPFERSYKSKQSLDLVLGKLPNLSQRKIGFYENSVSLKPTFSKRKS
jgi:hypothetical protein